MSKRSKTINSNNEKFGRTNSFYENNISKIRKCNNKFQTGIGTESLGISNGNNNIMFNKLKKQKLSGRLSTIKNINTSNYNKISSFNNSSKDLQKRINRKRRNSLLITDNQKNEKKKDNLLSLINFNILKTNQNLNNPEEFYNNYFTSLLEGEIERNNQKNNNNNIINKSTQNFFTTSLIDIPRVKKERIMRNKSSFRK